MTEASLTCQRCGKPIAPGTAQMGQPMITARELARAVVTPSILLGPGFPEVPYCADCRPIVAKQRTSEQLKVLFVLVGILILVALLLYVLF